MSAPEVSVYSGLKLLPAAITHHLHHVLDERSLSATALVDADPDAPQASAFLRLLAADE